jgi:multiple sugar transport system permease protein
MALDESASPPPALRLPYQKLNAWRRFDLWLDQERVLGYVLLAPAVGLLAIFVAYPFLYGLYISLTDSRIGRPGEYIGLENFAQLLSDPIFAQTVGNSFLYTLATTIVKLVAGMLMALLLNQVFPFKRVVRAAVLLPWIVPTVLSTLAWLWMFDSTYSVINWLLKYYFNLQGPIWLADRIDVKLAGTSLLKTTWPMISIMLVNIWRGTPFYGVSFLAGMQTIPVELYEAAIMDGARAWDRFWKITLPLLRHVISIVLLLSIILTLADFQIVYVLTRGGPANSTHLFATYAFQVAVPSTELGMGAAISMYMFPVLAIVVFFTLLSLRRED